MAARMKPLYGFDDLLDEAGLGSLVWSPFSYYAAHFYHYIIAGFTTAILILALALHLPDWFALLCISGYGLYFLFRKLMPATLERRFYRGRNQFIRAQVAVVFIALLLAVVPQAEQLTLWLLFVPVFLMTSKHCSTTALGVVTLEACLILLGLRWRQFPASASVQEFVMLNTDLWLEMLWLTQIAFILHFLVRNIQARSETIAAYYAVNRLASDVDMNDAASIQQWRPTLLALLKHLQGRCASAWLLDKKTRQLRCIAGLKGDAAGRWVEPEPSVRSLSIDEADLIADVARTGRSNCAQAQPDGQLLRVCPEVDTELAVPINIGSTEQQSTIGVLSIGFSAPAFKPRLIPEYENYMQALLRQAKPMLAYAQQQDELIALLAVVRQVSNTLDLNEVLDRFLSAIVETLGFEFATISLVDEEWQLIRAVRGINVPADWLEMATHPLHSSDIQAYTVRTGETQTIAGWDERFDRNIYARFGHDPMIRVFVPIPAATAEAGRTRAIGTIEAGYFEAEHSSITPAQLRMLDTLKVYLAIAIEHAQLVQRVQNKAQMLTSLHHVGQAIKSAHDFAAVLNEIGRSARSLLKADVVMLYRYHPAEPRIEPPLIFGELGGQFVPNLDPRQDTILTDILNEAEPYYSQDAQRDPRLVPPADAGGRKPARSKRTFIRRWNVRSFAGIPLIARGETVGIMFVNYFSRHAFDADERQGHELFAQQAAMAIHNAASEELARQLLVQDERAHLSRELHHSISQTLFAIKVKAYWLMDYAGVDDPRVRAELEKIADMAHETGNEAGFLTNELRAPTEENSRFAEGLEAYIQRIRRWYDFDVAYQVTACPWLSMQAEQNLLRLAREALNNAVRHARCKLITVRCEADEHQFRLAIQDDGRGFNPDSVPPGKWGLTNMRELADKVSGTLVVTSRPGHGTTIDLRIPSPASEEAVLDRP